MKKYLLIAMIALISCTKEVIFETDTTPPFATFTISNIDNIYTFDASDCDDVDGDIIYLKWNLDGVWTDYLAGYDNMFNPINRTVNHEFQTGTYNIQLMVKDCYGWTDEFEKSIIVK